MAATKATCAPSALLQKMIVANLHGTLSQQDHHRALTQGIEIGAGCSVMVETFGKEYVCHFIVALCMAPKKPNANLIMLRYPT